MPFSVDQYIQKLQPYKAKFQIMFRNWVNDLGLKQDGGGFAMPPVDPKTKRMRMARAWGILIAPIVVIMYMMFSGGDERESRRHRRGAERRQEMREEGGREVRQARPRSDGAVKPTRSKTKKKVDRAPAKTKRRKRQ